MRVIEQISLVLMWETLQKKLHFFSDQSLDDILKISRLIFCLSAKFFAASLRTFQDYANMQYACTKVSLVY